MISSAAATTPIVSHATLSRVAGHDDGSVGGGGHTRVLVVRKTGGAPPLLPVQVCADPTAMGSAVYWPNSTHTTAEVSELVGSNGLDTSATVGHLTYGGRTLTGSLDGEWRGERLQTQLRPRPGQGAQLGQFCFDLQLAEFSAMMLVLRHEAIAGL